MFTTWWFSEGEGEVAQSCPTLSYPMDCNTFSVHGILQARVLEWIAISFSKGSSRPRDRAQVSRVGGRRFNLWATREGFLGGSAVENLPANAEELVWSLGQEELLGKEMATYSSILPWEIHGQRRLLGYSPWGHKESDMTEQLNNDNQNKINWRICHFILLAFVCGENI